MKILLKALFTISIITFVTVVTAAKCDKKRDGATLEVKILDATAARLTDNGNSAIVYVLETETRGPKKLNSNDYDAFSQKDTSREVFSVSVKGATSGLTFSNPAATATSLSKMNVGLAPGEIPADEDFATSFMSVNVVENNVSFEQIRVASTWITRGFGEIDNNLVAMVCAATFDIDPARVAKIELEAAASLQDTDDGERALNRLKGADDKLNGAQESVCSFGSTAPTVADLKGWAEKAAASDNASDTVELAFVGIDFGDARLGDFISLVPNLLSEGISSVSLQKVTGKYKYGEKKVTVKIVAKLP